MFRNERAIKERFNFRETTDSGWVRVHAGRLQVSESPKLVPVSSGTSAAGLLSESLPLFGLEMANPEDFTVTEVIMHKGGKRSKNVALDVNLSHF